MVGNSEVMAEVALGPGKRRYRPSGFGCRQVSDHLTNQVDLVPTLKLGHYGFYD
jgi:hypothetical protein